jgi:hypothetical protein
MLKSAYELAMEKTGGAPTRQLSGDEKTRLAEIDAKYRALIAEKEIMANERIRAARMAGEAEAAAVLEEELNTEKTRLAADRDAQKEKIRGE